MDAVRDNIWSEYNTWIIRYLNTGEHILMFVAHDAEIGLYDEDIGYVVKADRPPCPAVCEMEREYTWFDPWRRPDRGTAADGETRLRTTTDPERYAGRTDTERATLDAASAVSTT